MNTNYLASEVAKNNAGEQEAIDGYLKLLTMSDLPRELVTDISEIISDEMNHTEILNRWITRLSGIQPNAT